MRQQVLVANWKMYKTVAEALAFTREFLPLLKKNTAQIIICPPITLLAEWR
jgi:triosephosphate isomerase